MTNNPPDSQEQSEQDKLESLKKLQAEQSGPLKNDPSSAMAIDEEMSYEAKAMSSAEKLSRIHHIHMDSFISSMRIKYAWSIFFLVVCWLISDILMVCSSGLGYLCVHELHAVTGAVFGLIVGVMWGQAVRSRRNRKDIKNVSQIRGDQERAKVLERNIQLRIWRGAGSAPISIGCMLTGGMLFYLLSYWMNGTNRHVSFHLENSVTIALITTTTTSILGILLIVMHWLFPQEKMIDALKGRLKD